MKDWRAIQGQHKQDTDKVIRDQDRQDKDLQNNPDQEKKRTR